jgi:hypothetical protein
MMDKITAYHIKHEQFLPVISKGDGEFTAYIEGFQSRRKLCPEVDDTDIRLRQCQCRRNVFRLLST